MNFELFGNIVKHCVKCYNFSAEARNKEEKDGEIIKRVYANLNQTSKQRHGLAES